MHSKLYIYLDHYFNLLTLGISDSHSRIYIVYHQRVYAPLCQKTISSVWNGMGDHTFIIYMANKYVDASKSGGKEYDG